MWEWNGFNFREVVRLAIGLGTMSFLIINDFGFLVPLMVGLVIVVPAGLSARRRREAKELLEEKQRSMIDGKD